MCPGWAGTLAERWTRGRDLGRPLQCTPLVNGSAPPACSDSLFLEETDFRGCLSICQKRFHASLRSLYLECSFLKSGNASGLVKCVLEC